MALQIKNTRQLLDPTKFRLKVLVYALSGTGKTLWASTAPTPGYIAVETGAGQGLLTVAGKGIDYVTPTSLNEILEAFTIFKDKETLILDSLSETVKQYVKSAALSIPRTRGESPKRKAGIPELDDYGTMGEMTRSLLRKLLDTNPDKHIIVTATEKYDKADPENGQAETLIGPDLPGAMFLGSPAMFDLVLRMRTRPALRDPKDGKSRYTQRYFVTQPDGTGTIAKCRTNDNLVQVPTPLLAQEEVFDLQTGQGTFPALLAKVLKGYEAAAVAA